MADRVPFLIRTRVRWPVYGLRSTVRYVFFFQLAEQLPETPFERATQDARDEKRLDRQKLLVSVKPESFWRMHRVVHVPISAACTSIRIHDYACESCLSLIMFQAFYIRMLFITSYMLRAELYLCMNEGKIIVSCYSVDRHI
jgi:hypothetical protein